MSPEETHLQYRREAARARGAARRAAGRCYCGGELRVVGGRTFSTCSECSRRSLARKSKSKGKPADTITHNGETLPLAEWAARVGLTREGLRFRIRRWKSLEDALTRQKMTRQEVGAAAGRACAWEYDQTEPGCPRCHLHGEHVCLPESAAWYAQHRHDNGDATIGRANR